MLLQRYFDRTNCSPFGYLGFILDVTCLQVLSKLHKACKGYNAWKEANKPEWKPWMFPEQNDLPRINYDDVLPFDLKESTEVIDETEALEDSTDEDLKVEE